MSSATWAMPKSISRGPVPETMTLPGLRSRWITPQRWISSSASAIPAASACSVRAGTGPCRRRTSCSDGPGMYSVASQGGLPYGSASTTGAVWKPPTLRAASISRAKRRRKDGSAASSGFTTFTATGRPPGVRPR